MDRNLNQTVREWLRLERHGAEPEAETALSSVFAGLPAISIPAGFADRILVRAGLSPTAAPPTPVLWILRFSICLSLLLTALFLTVLPSYLPAIMGIVHLGRLTEVAVSSFVGVVQQLGVGLVVWRAVSAAGSILTSILSTPSFLASLALGLMMSFGALRILHELIVSERSSRYVGPA